MFEVYWYFIVIGFLACVVAALEHAVSAHHAKTLGGSIFHAWVSACYIAAPVTLFLYS